MFFCVCFLLSLSLSLSYTHTWNLCKYSFMSYCKNENKSNNCLPHLLDYFTKQSSCCWITICRTPQHSIVIIRVCDFNLGNFCHKQSKNNHLFLLFSGIFFTWLCHKKKRNKIQTLMFLSFLFRINNTRVSWKFCYIFITWGIISKLLMILLRL